MAPQLKDPAALQVYLATLPPKERLAVRRELGLYEVKTEEDPLQTLQANCVEQDRFLASRSKTTAGFAGNQAGKTTGLVGKALIQHCPEDRLPEHLLRYKRFGWDGEHVKGRIVNPSSKLLKSGIIPTFRQWTPKYLLKDGSFDRSWHSQDQILEFASGDFIDFLTYEQELDKFGSVQRHYVGYDEPPPREIRDEGLARLMRFGGFEMFAMTPLKANTGWVRREIWRKRESPDITVCKWSIHDNKALSPEAVKYFLDSLPNDLWRAAREYGDFVEVGGLMYPRFEDWISKHPDDPSAAEEAEKTLRERVAASDIVAGIDPGFRNAAFVWVAFDRDGRALVFDELILQQKDASDYATAIQSVNARWGIGREQVSYVIDPSYRSRAAASGGENVESALAREGIYCIPGQNAIEAGVMQVNQRGNGGMLEISPACVGLRDEADEYAMEDREDGVFKEKRNDNSHRLDALRYVLMHRTWHPESEMENQRPLGWQPGKAPPIEWFNDSHQADEAPLGFMS